jgi:23S rRNA pseudouridine1911/1915/1917 synthase
MLESFPIHVFVMSEDAGQRLDQFLAARFEEVSRSRVQELIADGKVLVNDSAGKASLKLRGGERISVLAPAARTPLRAIAEAIPLDIVYEDDDLAVINKPAGMMVHAGAGATESQRNRGTLVNALLHHLKTLSAVGGEMRPGIVHRLDKETSGLIVVAKNDAAHRHLAGQFARRETKKTYVALVHGWVKKERGTISARISRDRVRRTRMTTRGAEGREAISHYRALRRIDSLFGKFTLLEVKIDTGRTHQIRVHMASLGHPIVGDRLYGAPAEMTAGTRMPSRQRGSISSQPRDEAVSTTVLSLPRNFLHAAELALGHPRTGDAIALHSPLPAELIAFLGALEGKSEAAHSGTGSDRGGYNGPGSRR